MSAVHAYLAARSVAEGGAVPHLRDLTLADVHVHEQEVEWSTPPPQVAGSAPSRKIGLLKIAGLRPMLAE